MDQIFAIRARHSASFVLFMVEAWALADALVVTLRHERLRAPSATSALLDHLAVTGSLLMIIGFTGFCFTLVLYATGVRYGSASGTRGPAP